LFEHLRLSPLQRGCMARAAALTAIDVESCSGPQEGRGIAAMPPVQQNMFAAEQF
jgi:hypothetical protein